MPVSQTTFEDISRAWEADLAADAAANQTTDGVDFAAIDEILMEDWNLIQLADEDQLQTIWEMDNPAPWKTPQNQDN